MDLYILTKQFFPKEMVSEFTSLIWTERYSSAGEVELVVTAIPSTIQMLAPGTLLGLRGSKEIMQVETHSIENNLLTVTGPSIAKFLNERTAWFLNPDYDAVTNPDAPITAEYANITTGGQIISHVVDKMAISTASLGVAAIDLDWAREKIQGLSLGVVDANGTPRRLAFPLGPVYDGIEQVANAEGVGFKMYLDSANYAAGTYSLKFATYRGKLRTRDQTANLMIRLSPKLDSLADVKELSSYTGYKNVVYVYYKNNVYIRYPGFMPFPLNFDRRVLMVEAPDVYIAPEHLDDFIGLTAKNAFANHVYIKAVDGRATPGIDYKFGTDYYLGDVIELEGYTGIFSKARVTEYIRFQDQYGEQEYPTLSVIDPLETGFEPDLEPNPDFEPDWLDDPNYDFNYPDTEFGDPSEFRTPLNPNDPPDFNPDPTPDFGPEDGGGDGGDGTPPPTITHEGVGYMMVPDVSPMTFDTAADAGWNTIPSTPIAYRWFEENPSSAPVFTPPHSPLVPAISPGVYWWGPVPADLDDTGIYEHGPYDNGQLMQLEIRWPASVTATVAKALLVVDYGAIPEWATEEILLRAYDTVGDPTLGGWMIKGYGFDMVLGLLEGYGWNWPGSFFFPDYPAGLSDYPSLAKASAGGTLYFYMARDHYAQRMVQVLDLAPAIHDPADGGGYLRAKGNMYWPGPRTAPKPYFYLPAWE